MKEWLPSTNGSTKSCACDVDNPLLKAWPSSCCLLTCSLSSRKNENVTGDNFLDIIILEVVRSFSYYFVFSFFKFYYALERVYEVNVCACASELKPI